MLDRASRPEWSSLTEEQKAEIIRPLAAEHATSTSISLAFTGASRNAVIGFCSRHKIVLTSAIERARQVAARREQEQRVREARQGMTHRELREAQARARAAAYSAPEPEVAQRGVSLIEIGRHQCRWPLGDPRKPGFGFCGEVTKGDSSYCRQHHERAHTRVVRLDA